MTVRATLALLACLAALWPLTVTAQTPTPADFFCPRPSPLPTATAASTDIHIDDTCVGNGIADDSDCIQAAITTADGAGRTVIFGPHTYKITRQIRAVLGNFTIRGVPSTIIAPSASIPNGIFNAFWFEPTTRITNSTTPALTVNANRFFDTAAQVSVTDSCPGGSNCFTTGDYVTLTGTTTYTFSQLDRISSVQGNTLVMERLIKIPLVAGQVNTVQRTAMLQPITIDTMTFDGAALTTPTANCITCMLNALSIQNAATPILTNLTFRNVRDTGLWLGSSWGGTVSNIATTHSGSGLANSQLYQRNTATIFTGLSSTADNSFGPGFWWGVDSQVTHLTIDSAGFGPQGSCLRSPVVVDPAFPGAACAPLGTQCAGPGTLCQTGGRGMKFYSAAYWQFTNVSVNNSAYSGIAAINGTYRLTFFGVSASNNHANCGLWMNGTDNQYNTVTNGSFHGNVDGDICLFASDNNNTITASYGVLVNSGTNNTIIQTP